MQFKRDLDEKRLSKWWMGGVASAGACVCTHFLDTIKVHQQTQQEVRHSMIQIIRKIIKEEGVIGLNYGLSAALLRQLTYSTFRFAFYEGVKQYVAPHGEGTAFYQKMCIASVGGALGGIIGTPTDVVTVRMQNDSKLPRDKRRNYKHVFDGLKHVYAEGGIRGWFSGGTMAMVRSVFMTVGQLSFYDQTKSYLLSWNFKDNVPTHFLASIIAGGASTTLSQPVDVIRTRMMNAEPGAFKGIWDHVKYTAKLGPLGFYKVRKKIPCPFDAVGVNVRLFFTSLNDQCKISHGAKDHQIIWGATNGLS